MNPSEFKDQMASQKTDTTNYRTYSRNIPSQPLQPYFDARPVSTKYSIMPIVDPRTAPTVAVKQMPTYNVHTTFNPGNDFGPWSGYASNVNNESILRNQIYGLQDCNQAIYVPSSRSDLYQVHWKENPIQQPFPDLFRSETPSTSDSQLSSNDVGYAIFNNATRQQVKDLKC